MLKPFYFRKALGKKRYLSVEDSLSLSYKSTLLIKINGRSLSVANFFCLCQFMVKGVKFVLN